LQIAEKSAGCPWHYLQSCGAFVAPLPIEKNTILSDVIAIAKFITGNWPQICLLGLCQSLHEVEEKLQLELSALLPLAS
jgi:hypothetical protein